MHGLAIRFVTASALTAVCVATAPVAYAYDQIDTDLFNTFATFAVVRQVVPHDKGKGMLLVTSDEKLSCHFTITPIGWSLVAFAKNDCYRVPDGDEFHLRLARDLQKRGAMRFRPVWVMHRIGTSIITIDWMPDHEQSYTPGEDVLDTLRDLDQQYDLHLATVVEESQCQTNFPSSLNKIRFYGSESSNSVSTPQPF